MLWKLESVNIVLVLPVPSLLSVKNTVKPVRFPSSGNFGSVQSLPVTAVLISVDHVDLIVVVFGECEELSKLCAIFFLLVKVSVIELIVLLCSVLILVLKCSLCDKIITFIDLESLILNRLVNAKVRILNFGCRSYLLACAV